MTSLDSLLANPDLTKRLTITAVGAVLVQIAAIQSLLAARLSAVDGGEQDELLTVPEAAKLWRMTPDSLYNCLHREPYSLALVKRGRRCFFSKRAILEQFASGDGYGDSPRTGGGYGRMRRGQ